jgi:hypothetical protein
MSLATDQLAQVRGTIIVCLLLVAFIMARVGIWSLILSWLVTLFCKLVASIQAREAERSRSYDLRSLAFAILRATRHTSMLVLDAADSAIGEVAHDLGPPRTALCVEDEGRALLEALLQGAMGTNKKK